MIAADIGDGSGIDAHSGLLTTTLTSLYAGGVDEITTLNLALNAWASVSGFTSLGLVADGGGSFAAAGPTGGAGNIRVAANFSHALGLDHSFVAGSVMAAT